MARRSNPRKSPPAGSSPLTFQGETAFYSRDELEMLAALEQTPENENAVRFIHACKVHLDATYVGAATEPEPEASPAPVAAPVLAGALA